MHESYLLFAGSFYIRIQLCILGNSRVVWINRLESIQRRFARLVLRNLPWLCLNYLPSYHERCFLLGLQPLAFRGQVSQETFVL